MKSLLLFLTIGCGEKEDVTLEETEEESEIQEIEEPSPEVEEETTEESSSYYMPQKTDVIKTINTISNEVETTDPTYEAETTDPTYEAETTDPTYETETVEVFETKQ